MGKASLTGTVATKAKAVDKLARSNADDDGDGDEGWRVLLLRGLVRGDIELAARALHDHIDVLSLPFTKSMPVWKVQWESMYWWILRDATPLFIAAMYSQPELVHWLLERGADRTSKCYLGRTPLDLIGECCETAMTSTERSTQPDVLARSEACRRLLTAPPSLPAPPMEGVQFACHISTQVVVVKAAVSPTSRSAVTTAKPQTPAEPPQATPAMTKQTIYKCLVDVVWETPLSNGALIEKYEVRQRLLAEEGDDGTSESGSWRIERATHNLKSRQQAILLEGLQFGSTYEFMLRSWNAAGKGDWGRSYKFQTLPSPEQDAAPKTDMKVHFYRGRPLVDGLLATRDARG